jgi:hypothetical protein
MSNDDVSLLLLLLAGCLLQCCCPFGVILICTLLHFHSFRCGAVPMTFYTIYNTLVVVVLSVSIDRFAKIYTHSDAAA